jgi:DNA mismatch repair ATPase MutS
MKDDITAGKSYYLTEVEAVLDLVAATRTERPHLVLFDELFRGTNAVERIAAGEAVLATMIESADGTPLRHVVVGATHDLELVDLLAGRYESFHFADRIDEAGLSFEYRLVEGPAITRNAIALLRLKGAPDTLVARAMARAAELDRQRAKGRE